MSQRRYFSGEHVHAAVFCAVVASAGLVIPGGVIGGRSPNLKVNLKGGRCRVVRAGVGWLFGSVGSCVIKLGRGLNPLKPILHVVVQE